MKSIFTIITALLISVASLAQKNVYVYVQDTSLAGYPQYTTAKYGLVTWLENESEWISYKPYTYHSKKYDTHIHINRYFNYGCDNWTEMTMKFIDHVQNPINDSLLYVYVGHNILLDTSVTVSSESFYENMLFGCFTNNWDEVIDNTLVNTTGFMAPEAYCVLPAIEAWIEGKNEKEIRNSAAEGYETYQKKTNLPTAQKLFGL